MEHISIHALREEGDGAPHPAGARTQHFYPRPPRGGRPPPLPLRCRTWKNFYPRPPRGGRHRRSGKKTIQKHFYPRPPRGGRLAVVRRSKRRSNISIHALHEEGDSATRRPGPSTGYFYPRPPRGGRPPGSIARGRPCDFYPRPPRGGRLQRVIDCVQLFQFLSTPSARRATLIGSL